MTRHQIPVALLEFDEGGNTLWVHDQEGSTVLRIKTLGHVVVNEKCTNIASHADMIVQDDIEICVVEHSTRLT